MLIVCVIHVPQHAERKNWSMVLKGQVVEYLTAVREDGSRESFSAVLEEEQGAAEPDYVFRLDNTRYQATRVVSCAPLEIVFTGSVESHIPLLWELASFAPFAGRTPDLYYIEDMFGRHRRGARGSIPLDWSISLNGESPMDLFTGEDGGMRFHFPSGEYPFQVRARTPRLDELDDGYYYLQLAQELHPSLD